MTDPDAGKWNHNIHYQPLLLDAIVGCDRVLDVGSGDGVLTRTIARTGATVVGLERDDETIRRGREAEPAVPYVQGDLLAAPFAPETFDAVVSVATLHHVDMVDGLRAMTSLLRPGGVLAIIGIARSKRIRDLPRDLAGAVGTRWHQRTKGLWEHSAPMCWPPPLTFAECRRTAEAVLPGVEYRRLVLWRYSLVWRRHR